MNDLIKELRQVYRQICESENSNEEVIRVHLIYNILLKKLGYDTSHEACEFERNKSNTFSDIFLKNKTSIGMIIETKAGTHAIIDADIIQLANYVRNNSVEYGLLTNGKEYVLINTNIRISPNYKKEAVKHQIVFWFNIFDSKSKKYTNHVYFRFLSKETIFDINTISYFRDIAEFKALKFNNENNSWFTYKSTLYRFFEFIADNNKKYKPLDEISVSDFEKFIDYKKISSIGNQKTKTINSDNAIMNNYSHISSMLNTLVQSPYNGLKSTHFDKDRSKSLSSLINKPLNKDYKAIDNRVFQQAIEYYIKKDKIRDLTIFLLCSCYGLERDKVQKFKWTDVSIERNHIKIADRYISISPLLKSCFKHLRNEKNKDKVKSDYIFITLYSGNYNCVSISSINAVFDHLIEIEEDDKWRCFSPQYVRNSLIIKLFDNGYSLDDIIYITGIPIENISNYISSDKIINRVEKKKTKISINSMFGEILSQEIV